MLVDCVILVFTTRKKNYQLLSYKKKPRDLFSLLLSINSINKGPFLHFKPFLLPPSILPPRRSAILGGERGEGLYGYCIDPIQPHSCCFLQFAKLNRMGNIQFEFRQHGNHNNVKWVTFKSISDCIFLDLSWIHTRKCLLLLPGVQQVTKSIFTIVPEVSQSQSIPQIVHALLSWEP